MKFKGLTNKILIENDLVVKYELPIHKLYLDKNNEFNILNDFKKSSQNIMIKPFDFYFENDLLVSKFKILKNFKTLEEVKITNKILDQVVRAIKKFHKIKVSEKVKKFDYQIFLENFFKNINTFLFDLKNEYTSILNQINFTKELNQVISHNDLVPGNIMIRKNKIKLIDYDFVMLNNIYFDIASFITETLNDNNYLIEIFIKKCLSKKIILKKNLDILIIVIKYQDLLWTLWANFMFEKTSKEIYKIICEEKYYRLINRKINLK